MRLGPARQPVPWLGLLLGAAGCLAVTAALVPFRARVTVATPALLLVVTVVLAAIVGGRVASLCIAVVATGAFNLAFIPPYWRASVAVVDDVVALGVFLCVALTIGTLVAEGAERRRAAERRAADARALNERYEVLVAERERLAEEATRVAVLEQVDRQRSALLRSVSHDLRTPLATIRAVTSDLRSWADYDETTRGDLLDLVGDEAERLDRIVANLLSMSRIDAGALQPERQAVALDELVGERVRQLSRLFGGVRVQVDIPADLPLVDADYSQLDQVLTNLVENGARHAPKGSTLEIGARQHGSMVELYVADEGIGVARFDRSRIFEPFRRGDGSTSSGVGLAICKAIVEAHGGTIEARTNPGGGARFVVTLPVRDG